MPLEALTQALAALDPPPRRVLVALSGGLDSICLLQAAWTWARGRQVALQAHHVHHGLSPHADAWLAFCSGQCAERDIPFTHTRLTLSRRGGESLEAVARAARHAALAACDADTVLFGHHLDDQVETFFLQLLRGAGPAGLAAMPALQVRGAQRWVRPWLTLPRAALQDYAAAAHLAWVDDESNADTRFDRNALRHTVLPVLAARFPHYRDAIARAIRWQQDALLGLDLLAERDAASCLTGEALDLPAWRGLPVQRAANVLRHWLRTQGCLSPAARTFDQLDRQLREARPDSQVAVTLPGQAVRVRVYRDRAWCVRTLALPQQALALAWRGGGVYPVPAWFGRLSIQASIGQGLAATTLDAPMQLCPRVGGERFRLAGRPRKSLKGVWQEAGVPVWLRDRWPLLYCGERLAWVPGIGYDADLQAAPGAPGFILAWAADEDALACPPA